MDKTMESPLFGWLILGYALILGLFSVVLAGFYVALGVGWLLVAAIVLLGMAGVLVAAGELELVEAENLRVVMARHRRVMRRAGLEP